MRIEGSHRFDRPREVVFPMLLDPDVLSKVLPGCERLEQVAVDHFKGTISIKIGPVNGRFDGDVEFSDLEDPSRGSLVVSGQGPSGFVRGTGRFWLENEADGCTLGYEGDAQIGGRLASVGQRLLDSSARSVIKSGLDSLSQQVVESRAGEPLAEGEKVEARSTVEFAWGVVRNMARDALDGTDRRRLLARIATTALAAFAALVVVRRLRKRP